MIEQTPWTTRDTQPPQAVYVQLRTSHSFETVRRALEDVWFVRASGQGTASDAVAYWFEVLLDARAPESLKERFQDVLRSFSVTLTVLQRVPVGMGPTMAKQMDLFGGS